MVQCQLASRTSEKTLYKQTLESAKSSQEFNDTYVWHNTSNGVTQQYRGQNNRNHCNMFANK